MSPAAPFHGCSIATPRYLAHARVLAESFREHHPGCSFSLLLIDDAPPAAGRDEPFRTLVPADVGIDGRELDRRATMYLTQGLATSLKPNLMLALLEETSAPVLFLDADSCVYGDMSHVAELSRSQSLVLSPHSLDPHPLWRGDGPEQIFLRSGVMNAGLIGAGAGAEDFLRWWAQRTARDCIYDEHRALLFEQNWLTLAVAMFEHHVLRDRGCNVAGWNLHNRDLAWAHDAAMIDGEPLLHFHFAAGYDPLQPELLTSQQHARWWPSLRERPGVARLSREYAERLIEHGYREPGATRPPYAVMPGGAAIEPWMRARFRTALMDAEESGDQEPPNPFSDGPEPFLEWFEQTALERVAVGVGASAAAPVADHGAGPLQPGAEESFDHRELMSAMADTRKLLNRIEEVEAGRDEAVAWAQRLGGELEDAFASLSKRDRENRKLLADLERARRLLSATFASVSWRCTRPLRAVKALLARRDRAAR
jgi:hypothetical protein